MTSVARRWQSPLRMRLLAVSLLVVAACDDDGAHLTFRAPDGPANATTFQIVLASPDLVPVIGDQRIAPKGLSTETVTYYLQRTAAGVTPDQGTIDQVDGFTVLVEPNATIADTTFIPFVVLYDSTQHVVGMGTFHATTASTDPGEIIVQRGQIDRYQIDIEPVTEAADTDPVDARQAMQITCTRDDQSTFLSGVVWRPQAGGELRLMMPDDPLSSDATQRKLDMDCDGHEVMVDDASADCDDTRARFYAGADEVCNGEDTSCDSIPYLVVPCTGPGVCTDSATSGGFALCDNTTGTTSTTCSSDVTCACAAGGTGDTGCHRCTMEYAQGALSDEAVPCQPATTATGLGTNGLCSSGPCTVEVLGTRGGWDVTIAASPTGVFGPIATGVTGMIEISATLPDGPGTQVPAASSSVGSVDLVIISSTGTTTLVSVDLEVADHGACAGNGPFTLMCD